VRDEVVNHNAGAKRALLSFGNRLSDYGLWFAASALLAVIAFNFVNIVLRYVFFYAIPWAEEFMLYLTIFGVYAGAISVAWQQAHIRIDGFIKLASNRWRRILHIVSSLVVAGILIPVVIASYRVVSSLFQFDQRSDALQLPMWIPQSIVPTSLVLIALISIARIFVPAPEDDVEHDPYGRS
jgi:C4-dicarboxylate transporter DctQ subunit